MTLRDVGLTSSASYRPGMDRRRFLLTSVAGTLAAPLGVQAHAATGRRQGDRATEREPESSWDGSMRVRVLPCVPPSGPRLRSSA